MPTWTTGGYTFPNYRPATPDPAPEITAGQKMLAKRAGASHIAPDGLFCYCWRFGSVFEAQWHGDRYGGWWAYGESLPAGVVKVDE
jgi:hypothetical protein